MRGQKAWELQPPHPPPLKKNRFAYVAAEALLKKRQPHK